MPKCRICKTPTSNRYGLTYVCNVDHALQFVAMQKAKFEARRKREASVRLRSQRFQLMTLEKLCARAQKDVNKYVMTLARVEGRNCISCNSPDISDAGHFIHAGSKYRTSRLRFELKILEPQCQPCNRFVGGGNESAYKDGLLLRYGQARLDEIKELQRQADSGELAPLTKEEVVEIGKHYRAMCRQLEKKS